MSELGIYVFITFISDLEFPLDIVSDLIQELLAFSNLILPLNFFCSYSTIYCFLGLISPLNYFFGPYLPLFIFRILFHH